MMSHRMMRLSEFFQSPIVKKRSGVKCIVSNCRASDLRETQLGIYCMKHYVDGKECREPDCHHPAIHLELCRECLNADDPEVIPQTHFFRSSISYSTACDGQAYGQHKPTVRKKTSL